MRLNVKAVHIILTSLSCAKFIYKMVSQCTYFCLCPTAYDAKSTTFQSICITSLSLFFLRLSVHSFASFIFSSSSFSLLSHCVVANKTPARWYRVKYIAQGIVGFFFSFSLSAVCTTFVCCFNLNVIFSLSLTLLAHLFAFYFARRCKGRPECNLECKQMINSAQRYFSMLRQLLLFVHITLSLKMIFWIGFCILIDLPFHLHLNRQWRCCCCGSSLFFLNLFFA